MYGVATISRLFKSKGLFCQRALQKKQYSAKVTYNFKEPTNRSHPIVHFKLLRMSQTEQEKTDSTVSFVSLRISQMSARH